MKAAGVPPQTGEPVTWYIRCAGAPSPADIAGPSGVDKTPPQPAQSPSGRTKNYGTKSPYKGMPTPAPPNVSHAPLPQNGTAPIHHPIYVVNDHEIQVGGEVWVKKARASQILAQEEEASQVRHSIWSSFMLRKMIGIHGRCCLD